MSDTSKGRQPAYPCPTCETRYFLHRATTCLDESLDTVAFRRKLNGKHSTIVLDLLEGHGMRRALQRATVRAADWVHAVARGKQPRTLKKTRQLLLVRGATRANEHEPHSRHSTTMKRICFGYDDTSAQTDPRCETFRWPTTRRQVQ